MTKAADMAAHKDTRKNHPILCRLTEAEYRRIRERADRMKVSVSMYLARSALKRPLPNPEKTDAIKDLVRINADLARLGNLFKMALDDDAPVADLETIVSRIRNTQDLLKQKVKAL